MFRFISACVRSHTPAEIISAVLAFTRRLVHAAAGLPLIALCSGLRVIKAHHHAKAEKIKFGLVRSADASIHVPPSPLPPRHPVSRSTSAARRSDRRRTAHRTRLRISRSPSPYQERAGQDQVFSSPRPAHSRTGRAACVATAFIGRPRRFASAAAHCRPDARLCIRFHCSPGGMNAIASSP